MAEEVPPNPVPKRRKRKASAAAETIRDFGPGAKLFGRYTLSRVLGRGGMGIVWLAYDDQLDRQVALKFLSQQIMHDHSVLADLKRETRRSLELTHPNIVRIHDFVQDARSACISMEFVDGETLSNLRISKTNQVFEVPDLEPLVAQWCEAMHYAHSYAQVVHCDLKPANLMLNVKGLLKITDFGIARSLSESASKLTVSRSNSGTLVYMSPQQLNGDPASVSDDIYSMGATLYELLTGKPPFYRGQIDLQIFDKIPPSIAVRRAELGVRSAFIVPLQWEDAIAACLSKETIERPKGALPLLNRLNLTSPLRQEPLRIIPQVNEGPDLPLAPGIFGLMQEQRDEASPKAAWAGPTLVPAPLSPVESKNEAVSGKLLESATTGNQPWIADQSPAGGSQPGEGTHSRSFYPSRRKYSATIVGALAVTLIIGLWYFLSIVAHNFVKKTPRIETPAAGIAPTPDVSATSPARTPVWTVTPGVSPTGTLKKESAIGGAPQEAASPTASAVTTMKRPIVPKDDITRFQNEVTAAERMILLPADGKTIQDRVNSMSSNGQANYEMAVAALEEGYPGAAEPFVFEAERTDLNNPLIAYLRGLVFLSQNKIDDSESALSRAATLDPEFREVEYYLASVAFMKKDYIRARKRFEHLASGIAFPTPRLKQLLDYRVFLGFLLQGDTDSAQQILQKMQADGETPAYYFAHAAWEFHRGDRAIAKQWLDSVPLAYSHDLTLVFVKPLYDIGWAPLPNIESTALPPPVPSATPLPSAAAQTLSLANIALSQIEDASAASHLNLRIGIASKRNTPNGHVIDIRVSFFDLTSTGQTVPTDAHTSYQWITRKRDWSQATTKYLTATYIRPKTSAKSNAGRKYGGYIVRLYFDDQFQGEKAEPTTLLNAFPNDKQAISTTSDVAASTREQNSAQPSVTPTPSGANSSADLENATSSSEPEISSEISALEDKWAVAVQLHDAEAVETFLADSYEAVTPTGRKLTKSQAVQKIAEDTDKYDLVEVDNIKVQVKNESTVVATGLLRERGKFSRGKIFERAYRFTDDWTKAEGKWLCTRSRTERATKR